jgi:NADPH2:quinone reductase
VLVRAHASSAIPADNSIATGMLKQMGIDYEFPVVLGRDYASVVEQVGNNVSRYAVGDEVFGFVFHANPMVRDGSWAELIVVPQGVSNAPVEYLRDLGVSEVLPRDGDLAAAARERHPDGFDGTAEPPPFSRAARRQAGHFPAHARAPVIESVRLPLPPRTRFESSGPARGSGCACMGPC